MSMSAVATLAAAAVALIPVGAGDQPFASSITDRGTVSVAEVSAYEDGRLLPRPLRGFSPWLCERGRGRNLNCYTSRTTAVFRSVATYKVAGGRSVSRVVVRRVAR